MADDGALRQRRHVAHKAGDHSLCVRCSVLRADPAVTAAAVPVTDALAALRVLGGQLVAAYGADPGNALLARELRMTLQALLPEPGVSADDEFRSLFAGVGAS